MNDVKWIKLAVDMFENRKIKYLRKLGDGDTIVLLWIMLLTIAGIVNDDGKLYIVEGVPYTAKMIADEFGYKESLVKVALEQMRKLNMICDCDGYIAITGWEEHQNIEAMNTIREQNRQRKARQRERDGHASVTDDVTLMSRECHADVTASVTDDVTQCHAIDREKEKDIDKDTLSFSLACACTREETKQKLLGGSIGKGVVFLSEEQINDLLERLSLDEFNHYVEVVADCILAGKRYRKSHYKAILDMAEADRKVAHE